MIRILTAISILSMILYFACSSKDGIVMDEETPESMLQRAQAAFDNGQYDKSMEYSQMLLDNFPTTDLHVDAQLLMAKSLGEQEEFEEQFDLLLRLLKENIIPEKVPRIYVQIGEFYEHSAVWNPGNITVDTTDFRNAAKYYRKAVFYPNSDDRMTKSKALYRAALMYAKINDYEIAKKAYAEVIDSYPDTPYSSLARIKLNDPTNTEEISIQEVMPAATAGGTGTGAVKDETAGSELSPEIADSLDLDLPQDDSDQPLIIDTTQATIPEAP